jgi:ABC-2 type transport system permease protein
MPTRYIVLEVLRQLRNLRSLAFTFAMPVLMLVLFGSAFGGEMDDATGIPWVAVTTVQMAGYGGMMAALSQSFSIVNERSIGWNRQLRITPLSGAGYLASKVLAAMAVGLGAIIVVSLVSVIVLQTRLEPSQWMGMAVGLWLGILPFTLIAILIGQFARPDFAQPLFMITFFGLSILGGLWFPLSVLPDWTVLIAQAVPSYWLNRLGQMGVGVSGSPLEPALVLGAWTLALSGLIIWRYRRDAARA